MDNQTPQPQQEQKPKNKTTTADLIKLRGNILHHFASVEMGMSYYICFYYFGRLDNNDFIHTVLYDKYMNVGIMQNIFEKLLRRKGEDKKRINILIGRIRELTRIRNIFAHSWVSSPDPNKGEFNLIGKNDMEDKYDAREEYKKFHQQFGETQKEVFDLIKNFKK